MPGSLGVGWVHDAAEQRRRNRAGQTFWPVYTREILRRLGATSEAFDPADVADSLERLAVLVLDAADRGATAGVLESFVQRGGVLVGFGTEGLDDLYGVVARERLEQPGDEFGIAAYLRLGGHPVADGIHSLEHPDQPLLAVSPTRLLEAVDAECLAWALRPSDSEPGRGVTATNTGLAAITIRRLGAGWACLFGFDPAQTMWAIHQGRRVDGDLDGDGYQRSMDARIIADNEPEVPYTDELQQLLVNLLGLAGVPLIDSLPPHGDQPADALIFFGGDDEGEVGVQVPASDFMASLGLPYHINLLPVGDGFAVGADEIARVEANGHELSLHYDFVDGFDHPTGFTRDDVLEQAALFRRRFGRPPGCTVNHWARWTGGCEPIRWMIDVGQIADNGWIGLRPPPLNPVNRIDFSFGTAFPRRPYDDAAHDHLAHEFVVEPVTVYEVGYQGDTVDPAQLRRALDLAVRYHLTANFFYHPVYLARYPACQAALRGLREMVDQRDLKVVFMGCDALAEWWLARGQMTLAATRDGDELALAIATDRPCVLKVPLGDAAGLTATLGGDVLPVTIRREFGQTWALVVVPAGSGEVVCRRG